VAVSMDSLASRQAAVPPAMPLEMPVQVLAAHQSARARGRAAWSTRLARVVTFGGALALTAYAGREMLAVISVGDVTTLQYAMVVLVTLAFGWIALSACGAVAGVLYVRPRATRTAEPAASARTALVMPICNEAPARSFAALQAMAEAMVEQGLTEAFEIFVLSDTSKPAVWIQETAAFQALRESLGDKPRIWYRRRAENSGRKAGNLKDFVTRWGGRYEYMIVLDADSILTAQTLTALVAEMQADAGLGLLQTSPRLCSGETLFARLQQFAGAIYGPIVARGVAAWQGDDGNYWGHNAIIRMRAFAESAGLPELPGRKPFGGQILSHDFVEAALLRRAGWSVRMQPTLGGSWEESPPSLLDSAARDRRWAQGNLQHLGVIRGAGLAFMSRVHLGIGVMSYLASPLWLGLVAVGLAVSVQVATTQYQYFGDEPTLFPRWAVFDSERMFRLFVISMVTLLLPKILGTLRALITHDLRRTVGMLRVLLGVVFETVLSALYAPVLMMMQSRQVWEILRGQDSGWAAQSRQRAALDWRLLWRRHWLQTVVGVAASAGLAWLSLPLLAYMSPALAGLVLAVPLSAVSGSARFARWTRAAGLLVVSEEIATPDVVKRRDTCEAGIATELETITMERLIHDEAARQRHFATLAARAAGSRGQPDLFAMSALAKIGDAHSAQEALSWFTPPELLAVLSDRALFGDLARLSAGDQGSPEPLRASGA
jgi:membrane glycosyltransferase